MYTGVTWSSGGWSLVDQETRGWEDKCRVPWRLQRLLNTMESQRKWGEGCSEHRQCSVADEFMWSEPWTYRQRLRGSIQRSIHYQCEIINPCLVTCLGKMCLPTLWARNCKTRKTRKPPNSPHSNFSPGISDEGDKCISRRKNREDLQLPHFFLQRWF